MRLTRVCQGFQRVTSAEGVSVVAHAKGCPQILEEGDPGADVTHGSSDACLALWRASWRSTSGVASRDGEEVTRSLPLVAPQVVRA